MKLTLMLFLCIVTGTVSSQLFTEVSQDLGINYSYQGGEYGGGASFFDADDNGWDDLTFCTNGNGILFYQNLEGVFQPPVHLIEEVAEFKQCLWVDYDNDGDSDLFLTRYFGKWTLHRNNGSIFDLEDVTEEAGLFTDFFLQGGGSSWGDYDNDGDLDVYIPVYDYTGPHNFFYQNNGDGTFTDISESSGVSDGSKASFQSLFFDYNQDGYQDLFVINDRLPWSNSFYKYDEGTFSEKTTQVGLEQYIFSMNNSISDIDHDGDYELYISNNPTGNSLFSYDSNADFFTDIAASAGVQVFDHSWSGLWLDADNDTWEDLHVSVSPFWGQPGQDQFFFNNGNSTFTYDINSTGLSGDASFSHTSCLGDFNNDGFPDFVVVNDAPVHSNLYLNNGNDNNFLKVELEGVESNTDALGSRIELWIDGDIQVRTTHGGEGYFTQNSQREMFGLGSAELIDSLVIYWPLGLKETMFDVQPNQTLHIVEGDITIENNTVYGEIYNSENNLCLNDSILLVASNSEDIQWNISLTSDSIWVNEPGEYYFSYVQNAQTNYSDTLVVVGFSDFSVSTSQSSPLCFGDETGSIFYELLEGAEEDYYSLNENEGASLENLAAGTYEFELVTVNGCVYSETIFIDEPEELLAVFDVNQALCYGETSTVTVDISGGTPSYSTFWEGFNPNDAEPGTYFPFVLDGNGCAAEAMLTIEPVFEIEVSISSAPSLNGDDGSITLNISGGTGEFTFQWSGPDGYVSGDQNIDGLASGFYTVSIQDSNGCIVNESILVTDVAVDELSEFEGVIYPQPANQFVTIESVRPIDQLFVYDLQGQSIALPCTWLSESKMRIEVGTLSAGPYILMLHSEKNITRTILIVQ